MTILLVGGGTGGHIIPLLAVAHELKAHNSDIRIVTVIDKATRFGHLLEDSADIDTIWRISAGKFRRYPNQNFVQTLFDFKTLALNIRDSFRVMIGFFEALRILKKEKPATIFIKGGFVAVPLGLAAHVQGRSFITHDSDAEPGLANKIVGRWAEKHLVGMPKDLYTYPQEKTIQVGIPVGKDFASVNPAQVAAFKKQLGFSKNVKLVLVTGGSQGATALNRMVTRALDELLAMPGLHIIHQTGKHQSGLQKDSDRYTKVEFISDMHIYTGAADVVVTRAGSFLAELATQGKPAVVVPAPHLAGGHQVKNAQILSTKDAAVVIPEVDGLRDSGLLVAAIHDLLTDKKRAQAQAERLQSIYPSGAAQKIANEIIKG